VQELLTKEALKLAERWDIPKEYCYPVRELCRCERLAKLDVLKFSELWFADLMTNCEPSEVRVAVCCTVLQCVVECCSVLQGVAVWCSVLHCVAVCFPRRCVGTFELLQCAIPVPALLVFWYLLYYIQYS